jgi:hypothetical protein
VLVGQSVVDSLDEGNCSENVVAHFVHGGLDAGAVVLGEDLHCDVACRFPGAVKVDSLDLFQGLEQLPLPASLNICAENAVPCLGEAGEFVAVETVEGGAGALKDQQLLNLGADRDTLALAGDGLNDTDLIAVTVEGVWVRLAVNLHAGPSVLDDLDVSGVDMGVLGDEVVADDGSELLWGVDRVLLCEDVGCLLLGVGGYDDRVVCLCVADVNVTLEQDADRLLDDGVNAGLGVLVDLVEADIVLAVAGVAELGHGGERRGSQEEARCQVNKERNWIEQSLGSQLGAGRGSRYTCRWIRVWAYRRAARGGTFSGTSASRLARKLPASPTQGAQWRSRNEGCDSGRTAPMADETMRWGEVRRGEVSE